jgi:pyruvate-ferredoxin/flavodoxin oxidoreductase
MGIINSTGCTSVWAATWPFNPYPFPWATHLFQDSPSMAMGLFEGHMSKMADGFKAIRMAELELAGEYNAEKHKEFFTYFNWKQFSDEEFALCPPVVSIGGDGAMYDIGFQNLSRMMMSGLPIKVLVVDTQVYSNTGGQNCTSSYVSQVSDMAPYGKAQKGKTEIRKEMALIAMAHRTTYVMQGSIANVSHMIEGFIDGINARRPALFTIYTTCQPEHGVADDATNAQTKLALESRAYPAIRFNPDKGTTYAECTDLEGNPSLDQDWPTYTLEYKDESGAMAKMEVPMTFADFALTEGRFRKHFKKAPRDTWNDKMVPVHEFIELAEEDRDGLYPFIWTVDHKKQLGRVLVAQELVGSVEERRDYWRLLKGLVGADKANVDAEAIAAQARMDLAQKLLQLAGGEMNIPAVGGAAPAAAATGAADASFEPAWVDSNECTACDECTKINRNIFSYNDKKKAYVKNAKGGPFKDIVKAAEKCTAGCIHTGTPANPAEPDLEKLVKRAAKYK